MPVLPLSRVQMQLPNGVDMLKTGAFKELNPLDGDWYYIRAGERRREGGLGVGMCALWGWNAAPPAGCSLVQGPARLRSWLGCEGGWGEPLILPHGCQQPRCPGPGLGFIACRAVSSRGSAGKQPPSCHPSVLAAAIARRVYCRQNIGVGAFRKLFGGRSHPKGKVAPEHFAKAAGGVIRHALQQLEALDLVAKSTNPKGGRRVTPQGQREMDLVASGIKVEPFALLLE